MWITKDLPQTKINLELAKFYSDVPLGKKCLRFIMAITSTFSVGLTLNKAVLITLLELDYYVAIEI